MTRTCQCGTRLNRHNRSVPARCYVCLERAEEKARRSVLAAGWEPRPEGLCAWCEDEPPMPGEEYCSFTCERAAGKARRDVAGIVAIAAPREHCAVCARPADILRRGMCNSCRLRIMRGFDPQATRCCAECDKDIPLSRNANSLYCSQRCQWRAKRKRQRATPEPNVRDVA